MPQSFKTEISDFHLPTAPQQHCRSIALSCRAAGYGQYCHRLTGQGHVWDTWHVARESYITAGEDVYLNLALGRCPSVAAPPLPLSAGGGVLLLELRTINRRCFHNHGEGPY